MYANDRGWFCRSSCMETRTRRADAIKSAERSTQVRTRKAVSIQEEGDQQGQGTHGLCLSRLRYQLRRQRLQLGPVPMPDVEDHRCSDTAQKWPRCLQGRGRKTASRDSECCDDQTYPARRTMRMRVASTCRTAGGERGRGQPLPEEADAHCLAGWARVHMRPR